MQVELLPLQTFGIGLATGATCLGLLVWAVEALAVRRAKRMLSQFGLLPHPSPPNHSTRIM